MNQSIANAGNELTTRRRSFEWWKMKSQFSKWNGFRDGKLRIDERMWWGWNWETGQDRACWGFLIRGAFKNRCTRGFSCQCMLSYVDFRACYWFILRSWSWESWIFIYSLIDWLPLFIWAFGVSTSRKMLDVETWRIMSERLEEKYS